MEQLSPKPDAFDKNEARHSRVTGCTVVSSSVWILFEYRPLASHSMEGFHTFSEVCPKMLHDECLRLRFVVLGQYFGHLSRVGL